MRLRTILMVFAKHGFGYFIDAAGLSRLIPGGRLPRNVSGRMTSQKTGVLETQSGKGAPKAPKRPRASRGERLVSALEELGPTFVKFGQLLSSRADILPPDVLLALSKLRDQVAPFSDEAAKKTVEEELGRPIGEIFSHFSDKPMAAASIGQVHRATLLDGSEVVVKVQRIGIERKIAVDMEILHDLAEIVSRNTSLKTYDLPAMVKEFEESMKKELDYLREAESAEHLRRLHEEDDFVRIPNVYRDLTTSRVLTLEYVEAPTINHVGKAQVNGRVAATNLAKAILREILLYGFFHADPHPGNVSVLSGNVIFLMDFGMTGSLSKKDRGHLSDLLLCLARNDMERMAKVLTRMGIVPSGEDVSSLVRDMDLLSTRYADLPLNKIKLGEAIRDVLQTAYAHGLRIPPQFTMAAKSIMTLEGSIQLLDPSVSVLEIAKPLGKEILGERMKPTNLLKKAAEAGLDLSNELREFPPLLGRIMRKLDSGEFQMKMEYPDASQALSRLDRIANKVSFSIALLGFSIVIAALIIGYSMGTPGAFGNLGRLPLLEVTLVVAALMVGYLMLAIFRSGRF